MLKIMGISQRLPTFVLLIHLIMQLTETYSHETESSTNLSAAKQDNEPRVEQTRLRNSSQPVIIIEAVPSVIEQILSNLTDELTVRNTKTIGENSRNRRDANKRANVNVKKDAKRSLGLESIEILDQIDAIAGYEPQKIDATKTASKVIQPLHDSENAASNVATVPPLSKYYEVPRQRNLKHNANAKNYVNLRQESRWPGKIENHKDEHYPQSYTTIPATTLQSPNQQNTQRTRQLQNTNAYSATIRDSQYPQRQPQNTLAYHTTLANLNIPAPTYPTPKLRTRNSSKEYNNKDNIGKSSRINTIHDNYHPPTSPFTYTPKASNKHPQNRALPVTTTFIPETTHRPFFRNNFQSQNHLPAASENHRVKQPRHPASDNHTFGILSKYDRIPRPFSMQSNVQPTVQPAEPALNAAQHYPRIQTNFPQRNTGNGNSYLNTNGFYPSVFPPTTNSYVVPPPPPIRANQYRNNNERLPQEVLEPSNLYKTKKKSDKKKVKEYTKHKSYEVNEDTDLGSGNYEGKNVYQPKEKKGKLDFKLLKHEIPKKYNYEVTEHPVDSSTEDYKASPTVHQKKNDYKVRENHDDLPSLQRKPNDYTVDDGLKKKNSYTDYQDKNDYNVKHTDDRYEDNYHHGSEKGDNYDYEPDEADVKKGEVIDDDREEYDSDNAKEPSDNLYAKNPQTQFRIEVLDQDKEGTHQEHKEHEEHKEKDESHEEGGGEEHKEGHHEEHGESGEKKYDSKHEHEDAEKGHHDKEDHKHHYDEEEGEKKKHEEEEGYHKEHHSEEGGEKEISFDEKGEHEKGHSTKGQHSVHKKDEFEKKTEFFDEFSEEDGDEKSGEYHHEHHSEKGGHHKSGHHHGEHGEEMHGKSGKHEKGHHHHEDKGHKHEEGHDQHHHHEKKYGKKGEHEDKKEWQYKKGDDGKHKDKS